MFQIFLWIRTAAVVSKCFYIFFSLFFSLGVEMSTNRVWYKVRKGYWCNMALVRPNGWSYWKASLWFTTCFNILIRSGWPMTQLHLFLWLLLHREISTDRLDFLKMEAEKDDARERESSGGEEWAIPVAVWNICDPVCEIQAKVWKSNYEITRIKVWFQPLISLWVQSLTCPYSVSIKDIKVTLYRKFSTLWRMLLCRKKRLQLGFHSHGHIY